MVRSTKGFVTITQVTEIEEIKSKLDIIDVVNRYIPLKKRGRHHVACCPFHNEKTPSFTVSPELQIFKCFGCGKSGDMFTFVQEFERVDFKDALEDLAKLAGVKLTRSQNFSKDELLKRRLYLLNEEVSKFYHFILTSHPLGKNCLDYLTNRGLKPETIKLFRLGFSPSNTKLITNYLTKKGFTIAEMIASGSFGQSQYHRGQMYDRFQDRLVFPLIDSREKVIGFSGRILPSSQNQNLAKYINSPETPIYHKSQTLFGIHLARESVKKKNSIIVVEGEFDMISPYQAGIQNIVAIKGTAFTPEQLQLIRRFTDTLILSLDSDFAGNNAARKSIELADSMEFDIKVVNLSSEFKDPDEAVKKDPQIFQNAVDSAVPVYDFIINSAVSSNDPTTVKGKRAILNLTLPFLHKIQNEVIRSDYFDKLAAAIGSSAESVKAEAAKIGSSAPAKTSVTPAAGSDNTDKKEEFLLSLVFSARKPIKLIKNIIKDYAFTSAKLSLIAQKLSSKKKFVASSFAASLPAEITPTFHSLYLVGTSLNLDSLHRRLEIKKNLSQLLLTNHRQRLNELSSLIAQAESHDDQAAINNLENEYNLLLQKISRLQSTKS